MIFFFLLTLALGSYAPPQPSAAEIRQSLQATDPAQRENTRARQRAWAAYCAVAGESLASLAAKSPALFQLDPQVPNHARLLREIKGTRDFLQTQHRPSPNAKLDLERQRVNYTRGLQEHAAVPADLARFAQQEVFACSPGFQILWQTLSARFPAAPTSSQQTRKDTRQ